MTLSIDSLALQVELEQWPLTEPFSIAGHTYTSKEFVVVRLQKEGHVGRGEAAGVRYLNDDVRSMARQIESVRRSIEHRVSRESLQQLLPPGGARNVLDCALWDLEAKLLGRNVWQLAALAAPKPLVTTFTCGADEPNVMAARARSYAGARAIKLKLTGDPIDADRVLAVREARSDVWISVDANQGFTRAFMERLLPVLISANVAMIEQPLPRGADAQLEGFASPIPIMADESVQSLRDVAGMCGRFDGINIKLDKCGGLSEGLAMARAAHELGLKVMVGNMFGTSLAMAPAFVLGQLCSIVDLDGPIFLQSDRPHRVRYAEGTIVCSPEVWGC
jgi:L-alanine-DL-glutamate epimerase-like enolase superfamily enzyme